MSRYTLKERFIQILLLIVIIHSMNPTIFAPSLHRLDADAKPLGDLLLGPIPSDAQPLIPRWKLEAFEQIHDRIGVKVATGGVGDASLIELGSDFASSVLLSEFIDLGDKGRINHRRFVTRARQPHHAREDGTRFEPNEQGHAIRVSS